jgi:RNA polymerase sigma-70 factor (ECF subfamily)
MTPFDETATRLLLRHRVPLFAYLRVIVRDPGLAEDLFQEVSIVLLRRWEEFGGVRDFWALARETARRQALAELRRRGRNPLTISSASLDAVDRSFEGAVEEIPARREALRQCLKKLPPFWRELVKLRYWMNLPVSAVAERLVRSQNTISVTLNRIRSRLADCVRGRIRSVEPS